LGPSRLLMTSVSHGRGKIILEVGQSHTSNLKHLWSRREMQLDGKASGRIIVIYLECVVHKGPKRRGDGYGMGVVLFIGLKHLLHCYRGVDWPEICRGHLTRIVR